MMNCGDCSSTVLCLYSILHECLSDYCRTLSVILLNVALPSNILISVVLDCVTLLSVVLMKLFVSLC